MPDGVHSPTGNRPDYHEAFVVAISRAHRFKKMLDVGKYGSVAEMAGALKISRYQMVRMLRLTLLAPDITESILSRNEPGGLSLNCLVQAIPELWTEQMRVME